jgi:hypothetical protein
MTLLLICPLHKSVRHAPFSFSYSSVLFCPSTLNCSQLRNSFPLITNLEGLSGKHSLYCWRSFYTTPLSSNMRPTLECSCVTGMCLPTRCLAVDSRFFVGIPAFTRSFPNRCLTNGHIRHNIYTECPRRNVPDFGRVFLMLKYTDITQNTHVQSCVIKLNVSRFVLVTG